MCDCGGSFGNDHSKRCYWWLVIPLLLVFPLHIIRTVFVFTAYPDAELGAAELKETILDFFAQEWA